ncbi:MAG TPA: extracellular solute-binding protein, partial [Chloroflexota bacterium]|nr:extracellular solute-binding protein [Chloroflexota bacterium]
ELFQKNSVKPPAAGWTWDDCLKTCQSLTKKSGQRVTQFGGSFASNIFPWLFANDANAIDVNNSKVTIDQKSAVDTLAYLGDLVVKYHVNPTPSEQTEMGQNFFLTGKVGMVVANRGGIGTAYRAAPFKIDVAPIPNSPSTGHSGSQITPLQMAIETPNKHPDEAWLLLDYLASFESQITRFTMYGGYPSRKSVAADPRFASSVQPSWVGTEINTKVMDIAADKNTGFIPNHPNWSEMNDALNKHLDDLWGGKLPADTVAKAAAADMSKLIG